MSALRKKSEVARYLSVPPEEVDRMMEEDGLPHRRVPGKNKPAIRFRLLDVYQWLKKYCKGAQPESYAEFEREFAAAQEEGKCRVPSEK